MAANTTATQAAGIMGQQNLFLYAALAGLSGLAAYAIYNWYNKNDGYAATPIMTRLGRKIIGPTEKFGHKVGKRLHYEERPKGYVQKAYHSTTDIDIDPSNELSDKELKALADKDKVIEGTSIHEYDSVVFSCSKGGPWPKRKVQKYVYKIGGLSFFTTPEGINKQAEYFDVNKENVEVRNNMIRIKDDADMVQVRDNYYRDNTQQSTEKLRQLTFSDMMEDLMQTVSNLGEQHHALNIETSREGTLMDKKWENIMDYNEKKNRTEKKEGMDS